MKNCRACAATLGIVATLLFPRAGMAAEGGYSNYIPGSYGDFGMALEPSGKLTLRNDVYYYAADTSQSVRSGRAEVGADLTFLMNFTTLIYKPDIEILGAQYAFGLFVPIVHADVEARVSVLDRILRVEDDKTAQGDIALIPLMLFWNAGNLHASVSTFIVTPTGDYDTDDEANTGLNFWSVDSNVALTYFKEETGQDYSFNLGYIYNTENSDTNYQTGQEIHLDVVANQFLSDTLAVGLQGFYLKQVTGDSGSGAILGDFKAEAAGVGPAILWGTTIGGQEVTFIAKWLTEFHVDNRLEGDHVYVSFVMDW